MPQLAGWTLEHQVECDSSNSELLRRAGSLGDRHALVVDAQTAGRGRLGRRWHSPPGANLYLSLFARLPLPAVRLSGLSLAIGIAAAETLRAAGATEVGVKWPNDLLARGRKLGGILIEIAASREQRTDVVIGIGLNLHLPPGLDVGQPAIDLATLGVGISRDDLLSGLLTRLAAILNEFSEAGFAAFLTRWRSVDLLEGKLVRVDGGPRDGGTACGVDSHGALRLRDADGEWRCEAGEVSVRMR